MIKSLVRRPVMFNRKLEKSAVTQFPAVLMGEKGMPLIGQAVNTIIPAILPWAAWPIRGIPFSPMKTAGN